MDHRKPKSKNFAHMVPKNRFWGELPRPEAVRQKDIDHQNTVLLTKIMGIMKRKNNF